MANEEHLKILRKGTEVWNKWRKANSEIKPDLQGAYFQYAYLQGADLQDADL